MALLGVPPQVLAIFVALMYNYFIDNIASELGGAAPLLVVLG